MLRWDYFQGNIYTQNSNWTKAIAIEMGTPVNEHKSWSNGPPNENNAQEVMHDEWISTWTF